MGIGMVPPQLALFPGSSHFNITCSYIFPVCIKLLRSWKEPGNEVALGLGLSLKDAIVSRQNHDIKAILHDITTPTRKKFSDQVLNYRLSSGCGYVMYDTNYSPYRDTMPVLELQSTSMSPSPQ